MLVHNMEFLLPRSRTGKPASWAADWEPSAVLSTFELDQIWTAERQKFTFRIKVQRYDEKVLLETLCPGNPVWSAAALLLLDYFNNKFGVFLIILTLIICSNCYQPSLTYVCNEQEKKACYTTQKEHSKKYLLEHSLPPAWKGTLVQDG